MTTEEIIKKFKVKFPTNTVSLIVDYDAESYVVCCMENGLSEDYNNPYYIIDKKNGEISGFSVPHNLTKFMQAADKNTIYKTGR